MEYSTAGDGGERITDLELAANLEQSIRTIWSLLPEGLQVSVITGLIDMLPDDLNGDDVRREIGARLVETDGAGEAGFSITQITRKDLQTIGLTMEDAERVNDSQLAQIARKMRSYVSQEDFWADLTAAVKAVLRKAPEPDV